MSLERLENLTWKECFAGAAVILVVMFVAIMIVAAVEDGAEPEPVPAPVRSEAATSRPAPIEAQEQEQPERPQGISDKLDDAQDLIQLCLDLTAEGLSGLNMQLEQVRLGTPPPELDVRVTLALLRSGARCSIDADQVLTPWLVENRSAIVDQIGEGNYDVVFSQLADFATAGVGMLQSVDDLEAELIAMGVLTTAN